MGLGNTCKVGFKGAKGGGGGVLGPMQSQCQRGGGNSRWPLVTPSLCHPRVNGAWPSWAPGRFPCSSWDAGPEAGGDHYCFFLAQAHPAALGANSGSALRQTGQPCLPSVLPGHCDLVPGPSAPSVAAPLPSQLSEKPRPRFSQLDVYRPNSQMGVDTHQGKAGSCCTGKWAFFNECTF